MKSTFSILLTLLLIGCSKKEVATLVIRNANIYTMDSLMPHATAMAILKDTIVKVGSDEEMDEFIDASTEVLNMNGRFIMPGFIEGHGHFSGVGQSQLQLNLLHTQSWQEVEALVKQKAENGRQPWIIGRGWHQDKWDKLPNMHHEGYPMSTTIDAFTKDQPVLLFHASGHALFANEAAMKLSGISNETPDPEGGRIVRGDDGSPIGVFEETAMVAITDQYNEWYRSLSATEREAIEIEEIEEAQRECLSKGVTSFQDAGSKYSKLKLFQKLSENDQLSIRLWVMLRDSLGGMTPYMDELPYANPSNHFYTCRAIKSEIDGALGAYGAWLLKPYADKSGFTGQNTTPVEEVEEIAKLAKANNMQLCIHAIGDKGNQVILDLVEEMWKGEDVDHRWRIEHAQHLHPNDIPRFAELGVIASMQAVHCTSDAPFVTKRLGQQRAKEGAYVWKKLLKYGAIVSNGTDAPVEDVNPLLNLYASVTRQRTDNGMVFFKSQAMTRDEALYSMTMAPAYAAFEDDIKGSLERGKLADFIVLNHDIRNCTEVELLETKVIQTFVGGKSVYEL